MKKSMMMMCIAALVALSTPALASQDNNAPPVYQEIQHVKQADGTNNEVTAPPVNKTESEINGMENSATPSSHTDGGYIVISGAGLLLLIILLIILL